jgi:hypothetical protein
MRALIFTLFLFFVSFGIKAQTFNFKRMLYVDRTDGIIGQGIDQNILSNTTFILTDSLLESNTDLLFKVKKENNAVVINEAGEEFIINISNEQIEITAIDKSKYYLFSL